MKSHLVRPHDVALILLAPALEVVPSTFLGVVSDKAQHEALIAEIQRFRGRVYVEDGALPASALDETGRHNDELDYRAWHIAIHVPDKPICGSIRVWIYGGQTQAMEVSGLRLHRYIARMAEPQRLLYHDALAALLRASLPSINSLGEYGAWAMERAPGTALLTLYLLASCSAFSRCFGDTLMLSASTWKHDTVKVLKRLGATGIPLNGSTLPPFHDEYHKCNIELLQYPPRRVPRFLEATIRELAPITSATPVIAP